MMGTELTKLQARGMYLEAGRGLQQTMARVEPKESREKEIGDALRVKTGELEGLQEAYSREQREWQRERARARSEIERWVKSVGSKTCL